MFLIASVIYSESISHDFNLFIYRHPPIYRHLYRQGRGGKFTAKPPDCP